MWVTLPEGTDVDALYQAAADRGVAFVKGTDFLLEGGENTLRLAYSGVTPQEIDAGVARLAEAYNALEAPPDAPPGGLSGRSAARSPAPRAARCAAPATARRPPRRSRRRCA